MVNIKQGQQMIPFITCDSHLSRCLQVGFWCRCIWFGFCIQIDSIEEPIKRNSVGPGNMSHFGTPSFDNHLDHCFVVFKHDLLHLRFFCVLASDSLFGRVRWRDHLVGFHVTHTSDENPNLLSSSRTVGNNKSHALPLTCSASSTQAIRIRDCDLILSRERLRPANV